MPKTRIYTRCIDYPSKVVDLLCISESGVNMQWLQNSGFNPNFLVSYFKAKNSKNIFFWHFFKELVDALLLGRFFGFVTRQVFWPARSPKV